MFGIQNGVGAALASALLGLLLVTGAASESAGSEPVDSRRLSGAFTPDPEGVWRTITPSDSTSECIGDPVAPLCAVESHLACYRRHEPDLCRIAYGPEWEEEISFPTYPPKTFFSYRVKKTWLAGPKDLEPLPNYAFNRELGDLMIDVIVRTCWTEDGYCSTPIIPTTFTARKFGERWAVVEIYLPWHSTKFTPSGLAELEAVDAGPLFGRKFPDRGINRVLDVRGAAASSCAFNSAFRALSAGPRRPTTPSGSRWREIWNFRMPSKRPLSGSP